MREIIKVKACHIACGQTISSEYDPIALAIRDTGLFEDVHVGYSVISVKYFHEVDNHECPTPNSVKRFIQAFDTHKDVKAFNFLLTDIITLYDSQLRGKKND